MSNLRTNNALDSRKKHLVNIHLESMRDEIQTQRPTVEMVAKSISEKLGFEVSSSSIVTACVAIELSWPRGHKRLPQNQSPRFGGEVYKQLRQQRQQIAELQVEINALRAELGLEQFDFKEETKCPT